MTIAAFRKIAEDAGLSLFMLASLSQCQSQVYHEILFDNTEDGPETPFQLGTPSVAFRRALVPLRDAGYIALLPRDHIMVTPSGWALPCNSGASVFFGSAAPEEIFTDTPVAPKTRFGPRFPVMAPDR